MERRLDWLDRRQSIRICSPRTVRLCEVESCIIHRTGSHCTYESVSTAAIQKASFEILVNERRYAFFTIIDLPILMRSSLAKQELLCLSALTSMPILLLLKSPAERILSRSSANSVVIWRK